MVTEAIITFALGLITDVVALMPILTVPVELLNGLAAVVELLVKSRYWIPWNTVFVCVGWLLALYSFKFVVSIANWIVNRLPIVG